MPNYCNGLKDWRRLKNIEEKSEMLFQMIFHKRIRNLQINRNKAAVISCFLISSVLLLSSQSFEENLLTIRDDDGEGDGGDGGECKI